MGIAIRKTSAVVAVVTLLLAFVAVRAVQVHAAGNTSHAVLRDAAGSPVGSVTLSNEDGVVLVRAVVHDLPPGFHGFHIHAVGSCVSPSFTSAGGHYNPGAVTHGAHAGDLPSLLVLGDGTGKLRFVTDRVTLPNLEAGSGTAIIIHAGADNFGNVPVGAAANQYTPNSADATALTAATGNAGARIACGVIS